MDVPLFGQEHVDRYRETDGEEGHDGQGTTVLLLTTTRRKSGARRTTPLIYQPHGDDYVVVASNGGSNPPGWFLNLQDDPIVAVHVKADHHTARARVATAEEKPELWRLMTATGAPYDEFQAKANSKIPVVILEPAWVAAPATPRAACTSSAPPGCCGCCWPCSAVLRRLLRAALALADRRPVRC